MRTKRTGQCGCAVHCLLKAMNSWLWLRLPMLRETGSDTGCVILSFMWLLTSQRSVRLSMLGQELTQRSFTHFYGREQNREGRQVQYNLRSKPPYRWHYRRSRSVIPKQNPTAKHLTAS